MGRDRKSRHKLSRRNGKDLFGTGGESLQRRLDQPPGMQGRKPNREEIDPGIQERRIVELYSR